MQMLQLCPCFVAERDLLALGSLAWMSAHPQHGWLGCSGDRGERAGEPQLVPPGKEGEGQGFSVAVADA